LGFLLLVEALSLKEKFFYLRYSVNRKKLMKKQKEISSLIAKLKG
jgi:hypothetical protein